MPYTIKLIKDIAARHGMALAALLMLAACLLLPSHAVLAQTLSFDLGAGNEEPGTITARLIQLIAVITILSLAPGILMMMTSFTRLIVILSFLRTAIGLQQSPPNAVLISLALFLTFFIMAPTFEKAFNDGMRPYLQEEIDEMTAFERTVEPFKMFMLANTRSADLQLFADAAKTPDISKPENLAIHVVIPAFMISELRRAFEIGFLLFLPFLIIDMVTSSILMAMGMMMLPPVTISLPFKIIFFVLVDGWALVVGSLIQSYQLPPIVG